MERTEFVKQLAGETEYPVIYKVLSNRLKDEQRTKQLLQIHKPFIDYQKSQNVPTLRIIDSLYNYEIKFK